MAYKRMIEGLQRSRISSSIFPFAMWKNLFSDNKQLNDEIRYVLDRKQLPGQLGNTLDRPTLLMKRTYVRKTEMDQEHLDGGAGYGMMEEQM